MAHDQAPPGRVVGAGVEILVALARCDVALAAHVDALAFELQHDARRGVGHGFAQDGSRCSCRVRRADGPQAARRASELGNIADGQDVRVRRAHEGIDTHTVVAQREAGLFGQEGVGLDAQRRHKKVGPHARPMRQLRQAEHGLALVALHRHAGDDLDADAVQIALQPRGAFGVQLRVHQAVGALQQRDLQPQAVQRVCGFHAQHAATDDHGPLGLGAADVVANALRVFGRAQHESIAVLEELRIRRPGSCARGQHQLVVRQPLAAGQLHLPRRGVQPGGHHATVHGDALLVRPVRRHQQQTFQPGAVVDQPPNAHAVVEIEGLVADDVDLHAGAVPPQGLGHAHAGHAVAHDDDPLHAGLQRLVDHRRARQRDDLGRRCGVRIAVDQHRPADAAHAGQPRAAFQAQAAQRGQFVFAGR